jgi:hypothetical protein
MVGYLPRSGNNDLPLCSSLFNSWNYSTSNKRPKEEIDNDEFQVTSKKQRIEKEDFLPYKHS